VGLFVTTLAVEGMYWYPDPAIGSLPGDDGWLQGVWSVYCPANKFAVGKWLLHPLLPRGGICVIEDNGLYDVEWERTNSSWYTITVKPKSAKAKGRRLSTKAKDIVLKYLTWLKPDDVRVTPSGVTGPDLQLSPAAQQWFPFAVECKNQESLNIWEALAQATVHADGTKLKPIVVFSRNGADVYCALRFADMMDLLSTIAKEVGDAV
jgi:hypothetical protein